MNGAAAVPDSTMNTPSSNRTATIGKSHHFLLYFRNSTNSETMPPAVDSAAAFSKSSAGGWLIDRPQKAVAGVRAVNAVNPAYATGSGAVAETRSGGIQDGFAEHSARFLR